MSSKHYFTVRLLTTKYSSLKSIVLKETQCIQLDDQQKINCENLPHLPYVKFTSLENYHVHGNSYNQQCIIWSIKNEFRVQWLLLTGCQLCLGLHVQRLGRLIGDQVAAMHSMHLRPTPCTTGQVHLLV